MYLFLAEPPDYLFGALKQHLLDVLSAIRDRMKLATQGRSQGRTVPAKQSRSRERPVQGNLLAQPLLQER